MLWLALTLLLGAPARAPSSLSGLPERPSGAVRVFLVRHGQAYLNINDYEHEDNEGGDRLTSKGRDQARWAARKLAGRGIDTLIVSPAGRTAQTAEEMGKLLGIRRVEVDERLKPLRQGRDRRGRHLTWRQRQKEWEKGRDPDPPGGESLGDVGGRVNHLIKELRERRHGDAVLLVTHNEVISSWLGLVRGLPPWKRFPPGVRNASITVADLMPDGRVELRAENVKP